MYYIILYLFCVMYILYHVYFILYIFYIICFVLYIVLYTFFIIYFYCIFFILYIFFPHSSQPSIQGSVADCSLVLSHCAVRWAATARDLGVTHSPSIIQSWLSSCCLLVCFLILQERSCIVGKCSLVHVLFALSNHWFSWYFLSL